MGLAGGHGKAIAPRTATRSTDRISRTQTRGCLASAAKKPCSICKGSWERRQPRVVQQESPPSPRKKRSSRGVTWPPQWSTGRKDQKRKRVCLARLLNPSKPCRCEMSNSRVAICGASERRFVLQGRMKMAMNWAMIDARQRHQTASPKMEGQFQHPHGDRDRKRFARKWPSSAARSGCAIDTNRLRSGRSFGWGRAGMDCVLTHSCSGGRSCPHFLCLL